MKQRQDFRREALEVELFNRVAVEKYGLDLSRYQQNRLHEKLLQLASDKGYGDIAEVLARLLRDELSIGEVLNYLTVTVTEMFRDPNVFAAIRCHVRDVLASAPRIRVWHAGAATGEEVLSVAITLYEEGCLERTYSLVTDINRAALLHGEKAVYPIKQLKTAIRNYHDSNGKKEFSRYFTQDGKHAAFRRDLLKGCEWMLHDVLHDEPPEGFDLVLCRNVLIYYEKALQQQAFNNFARAMNIGGVLVLGDQERIIDHPGFARVSTSLPLYRRLESDLPCVSQS